MSTGTHDETANPEAPVLVHVANLPAPGRRLKISVFYTRILTAADPAQQILIPNPDRCEAQIIVFDNPVVLGKSQGDVQAGANLTDVTLAAPQGAIVPNTAPNAMRNPYLVSGTNEVWAAAAAYPTRISVQAVNYATE